MNISNRSLLNSLISKLVNVQKVFKKAKNIFDIYYLSHIFNDQETNYQQNMNHILTYEPIAIYFMIYTYISYKSSTMQAVFSQLTLFFFLAILDAVLDGFWVRTTYCMHCKYM